MMIDPSRIESHSRRVTDAGPDLRVVRSAPPPTSIDARSDEGEAWALAGNRRRAEGVLAKLESAVRTGRQRRADRLRAEFLGIVQQDRTAAACLTARDENLRLEPVGHGDLLEAPTLYQLRRTPWRVRPLTAADDPDLPEAARRTRDAWRRHHGLFDALYRATEAPELLDGPDTPRPARSFLIGVISADGSTGDWFVLADWPAAG